MNLPLKIGSRSSALALAQVEEVLGLLKSKGHALHCECLQYSTAGDRDKKTSLTTNPLDNFFTDSLDQALLKGDIDVAIHSAKDLPKRLADGLSIFALTQALDDKDAWVGQCHWVDLPQGAKVGTSSQLRQAQVLQLRADIKLVDIRGTIEERIELIKQGQVDGIIVAVCALKRLGKAGLIKDIFPWYGMPLQGQLAVVGRRDNEEMARLFQSIDVRRSYGKVVLVGAGPGDPELITLKGIKALEKADCVFYDYLADVSLLKYAPNVEHVYAGKRKGDHALVQGELNRMLKDKAFSGKEVVRLKGGDPLVFGRGGEEIEYLRSYHIQVDVVPGVSSATGIPSLLGLPLTARGVSSSVAFVSAHGEGENVQAKPLAIPKADSLVFLMGLSKLKEIVEGLMKAGWDKDTPVVVVSKGTRPDEQILKGTIETIRSQVEQVHLPPPAIIIVGKTVDFYQPAVTKTFLHCGTHPDLYKHYGRIVHWPLIEITPIMFSSSQQKKLWEEFESADVIICTSRYAVQCFIKALLETQTLVDFSHKAFVAIGQYTKKTLAEFNITPVVVAKEETAQGLFAAMVEGMDVKGKRMIFPRSSIPNPFLAEALRGQGASVSEITVYANTKPPKRDLPLGPIDGVIFTSPSTVRNFINDYGKIPDSWDIIAKGPVTANELRHFGYNHYTCEH